jgi:hypothetical protein
MVSHILLSGRFRWITTSIGRFDIDDGGWPSDRNIVVLIRDDLTTFDGLQLEERGEANLPSRTYNTREQYMYLAHVASTRTMSLTSGLWNAYVSTKGNVPECPPDAVGKYAVLLRHRNTRQGGNVICGAKGPRSPSFPSNLTYPIPFPSDIRLSLPHRTQRTATGASITG